MAIDTFELIQPSELIMHPEVSLSISGGYNLNCAGGNDGTIILHPEGGDTTLGSYRYYWHHNGSTAGSLGQLEAGNYIITVTDGINCSITDTVSLTEPSPLVIDSLNISDFNGYEISCAEGNNGSIHLYGSGGEGGFTYDWLLNGVSLSRDTCYIDSLIAGQYTLNMSDGNYCQTSWTGSLEAPPRLNLTLESSNVSCMGTVLGTADAEVSGGVGQYSYQWDNGATTASISGLTIGDYILEVRDMNQCVISDTSIIKQNTVVQIEIQVMDSISCYLGSDGVLHANATQGIGPYNFEWNDGRTTETINGIDEGTWTVDVEDSEGCTSSQSIVIDDPEPLKSVFTVTDALCYGSEDGSVLLGAIGGRGGYRYYWQEGLVSGSEVQDLGAGTYVLRVSDRANCQTDTLVSVQQPEKLEITMDELHSVYPFCPDWQNGALAIKVTGGTREYQYHWNGYPGDADSVLNDIKEGKYMVEVTDAQGCITEATLQMLAANDNCLNVPSAFTPNSDGANDTWDIRYINESGMEAMFYEIYPNGEINVYDRLGNIVYRCANGCAAAWNGEDLKGRMLPVDSYYFIIKLNNGEDQAPLKGIVTIIR
jgi:gliding motility-associated-like protein